MSESTREPSENSAIVGLFVNGEVLFPHARHPGQRTVSTFPVSDVLAALFRFAEHFGSDIRERVVVRNWDDPSASTQSGVLMAGLQRGLFQLVHVPPDLSDKAATSHPNAAERKRELQGALERRATNWANQMVETVPGRPVHVVVAGLDDTPELPDGVSLARLEIRYKRAGGKLPVVLDIRAGALVINRELWNG